MTNPKKKNISASRSTKEGRSSKSASQTNVQTKKADSDQSESPEKTSQSGFSDQRNTGGDMWWRTGVDNDSVTTGNP